MRAVLQRVTTGAVLVEGQVVGQCGPGLVVLLGVGKTDQEEDARYLAEKIVHLRIFNDNEGKMNLSVKDSDGEMLVVSQFTLYGDCVKGRRPSFAKAALPQEAQRLYEFFIAELKRHQVPVQTGVFQAHMDVKIENDGPVTILLDSSKAF